jgi:hypothetical protein
MPASVTLIPIDFEVDFEFDRKIEEKNNSNMGLLLEFKK